MLHRTNLRVWPSNLDHFALERMARELRRDYIERLIRRVKAAFARRFANDVPPSKKARAMTSTDWEKA